MVIYARRAPDGRVHDSRTKILIWLEVFQIQQMGWWEFRLMSDSESTLINFLFPRCLGDKRCFRLHNCWSDARFKSPYFICTGMRLHSLIMLHHHGDEIIVLSFSLTFSYRKPAQFHSVQNICGGDARNRRHLHRCVLVRISISSRLKKKIILSERRARHGWGDPISNWTS